MQIPGVDADHVKEPFIDVCVGGTEIPGGEPENFCVWAITILGRVSIKYLYFLICLNFSYSFKIYTKLYNLITKLINYVYLLLLCWKSNKFLNLSYFFGQIICFKVF